jgi:DNA-binding transcriptional ArsR family regulator
MAKAPYTPPPADQLAPFAEMLKVIGHAVRLRIVLLLTDAGDDGQTVSQICQSLELPQATASQHLILLKQTGVLSSTKTGTHIRYRVANKLSARIGELAEATSN